MPVQPTTLKLTSPQTFLEAAANRREGKTTLGIPAAELPGVLRDALLESLTLSVLTDGDVGAHMDIGQRRQLLQFLLSQECAIEVPTDYGELDWESFADTVRKVYGCNFNPGGTRGE